MLAAIHPDRLRMALFPDLSPEAVARLMTSSRLRERIESAVANRYPTPPAGAEVEDAPEVIPNAVREAAIVRAGLALLVGELTGDLRGASIRAAARTFGEDVLRFALANAPAGIEVGGDEVDRLAVERAGRACLTTWRDAAPTPSVRRARTLLCPPGTFCGVMVTATHREVGPGLFARALSASGPAPAEMSA